jgi:hypothetical protein
MKRRSKLLAVAGSVLALGMISGITASAADAGPRHDALEPLISATRKYHRLGAAIKAHYSLLTDVNGVTCIDGPPSQGNMGRVCGVEARPRPLDRDFVEPLWRGTGWWRDGPFPARFNAAWN